MKHKYRILKTGELLQVGDEYCVNYEKGVWWTTLSAGYEIPYGYEYRRLVKDKHHPQTDLFK